MSKFSKTVLALALISACLATWAQTGPYQGAPSTAPFTGKTPSTAPEMMVNMEQHMKTMHEMHQKMEGAKTEKERQALVAEQTKLMQEGMAMMDSTRMIGSMAGLSGAKPLPGSVTERQQMMEKRMEMMQTMMQMMMDRMPLSPAK